MRIGFDFPKGSPVSLSVEQNGKTTTGTAASWKDAHVITEYLAGRFNKIEDPDLVEVLPEIKDQGNGLLTLDLTRDFTRADKTFTTSKGKVGKLSFVPREVRGGWGEGEYYFLPQNAQGRFIVEPGRNHRKIYVTGAASGYTRAKIATEKGLTETQITNDWIIDNAEYATQAKPLVFDLAQTIFKDTLFNRGPGSHWLLFERGYTYPKVPIGNTTAGESYLHPVYITAWGTGAKPIVQSIGGGNSKQMSYIVIQDIDYRPLSNKVETKGGTGYLLAHSDIFAEFVTNGFFQMTFHEVKCLDGMKRNEPGYGYEATFPGYWEMSNNRASSIYASDVHGMLLDRTMADMGGWDEGYDPWLSADYPQPPSALSHALYIQYTTRDCLYRDMWVSRGASQGIQSRAAGVYRDCFVLDNNMFGNALWGHDGESSKGNYALFHGTVATSAAYKRVYPPSEKYPGAPSINLRLGSLSNGWDAKTPRVVMLDNIICHAIDPDNPGELAADGFPKGGIRSSISWGDVEKIGFDNTIVYKWGTEIRNADKAPASQMDTTTAQRLAKLKTGTSTIAALCNWARGQTVGHAVREALDYFRKGFGIYQAPRTAAETLTFIPDIRGDGFRWDNRMNWPTNDLPGTVAGDIVDLNGNFVRFGSVNAVVSTIELSGGKLDVTSGKLSAGTIVEPGVVSIRNSGQLDATGGNSNIDYTARGGRLILGQGEYLGNVEVSGNAEVLLGPDATLPVGKTLTVYGDQCCVGWDGTGNASLKLNGTLRLRPTYRVNFASYPEIRMIVGDDDWIFTGPEGFRGTLDIQNQMLVSVGGNRWVAPYWFRDFTGKPVVDEILTRSRADGGFDKHPYADSHVVSAYGPSKAFMPTIRKFRSGIYGTTAPAVTPTVVLSGPLELDLRGMAAGTYPLIEADIIATFAGLTVKNLNPALDATVTVTGTGVTLTLAAGTGQAVLA